MTAVAIRQKLENYIRFADNKKLKAIYTLVENDIEENYQWWKDKSFIAKLDKDIKEIKSGKQKTFTVEEVRKGIDSLRKKRQKTK